MHEVSSIFVLLFCWSKLFKLQQGSNPDREQQSCCDLGNRDQISKLLNWLDFAG